METMIKTVAEKSNISESQAKIAIDAVISFLKDKMPGGIGAQVETFIKGNSSPSETVIGTIKEKTAGVFGK